MSLVATDDPDEQPIAPLPPHERPWRHPSELARAQRVASSIPPPPLSRLVAGIALGMAAVLSIVLVVLVLPRTGGREDLPAAAAATPTTVLPLRQHSALDIASLDQLGRTYLLPVAVLPPELFASVRRPPNAETLFVTTASILGADRPLLLTTKAGSLIPLSVAGHDPRSGLSLLRSMLRIRATGSVDVARQTTTSPGTPMVLHGRIEHRVKVGLRVASDSSDPFVPFDVDGTTKNVVDAAPVTDLDGRFAGLFVHRNGAVGVVPVSAIVAFVERVLQSPG